MIQIQSKLASAFACLSYHFIKRNKEDLLYEIPGALRSLSEGLSFCLTVRSTGADGIGRFMSAIRQKVSRFLLYDFETHFKI